MTRVSFHRLAERELNDAALYYERESPGLGVRFLDEIQRYIDAIVCDGELLCEPSYCRPTSGAHRFRLIAR
jgi:hypothetical protein